MDHDGAALDPGVLRRGGRGHGDLVEPVLAGQLARPGVRAANLYHDHLSTGALWALGILDAVAGDHRGRRRRSGCGRPGRAATARSQRSCRAPGT